MVGLAVPKIDVRPEWWDNIFAPSSCLVLITTVDASGRINAASFGTCVRVCHDPVCIAFTAGASKDTAANVLETGQFVVNIVPFERDILDKVLVCGLPFKAGIDELQEAGLTALPSRVVKAPRIAECRSHFECSVAWTHQWLHRLMICGTVEAVSIDEDCVTPHGSIVWDRLKPAHYCGSRYRDRFVPVFDRPTRAEWHYDGTDDQFRSDENWRAAYQSTDGPTG